MTATPGQAAHAAWSGGMLIRVHPWDALESRVRGVWEAAAQAAIAAQEPKPVPELAESMRESVAYLTAEMHAEADASSDDAKAAALHEYAARIRQALGPEPA